MQVHLQIPPSPRTTLTIIASATFQQALACDIAFTSIRSGELLPDDLILERICVESCLSGLETLREDQLSSCSDDSLTIDGGEHPPSYLTDVLLFTYNYTCLRDP